MTKRGFRLGRFLPAIFTYFLQPPNVTGTFPFLQATDFSTTYYGQTIKEATFGGIFACLPILWVLFFSKPVLALRSRQRATHTVLGVVISLTVMGFVIAMADAQIAGILERYYADFTFMFLAAALLLVFIINEHLTSPRFYGLVLRVLIALVGVSLIYSAFLCFIPETGWVSDIYPWAYQDLVDMFQFWA
ncbi:MAG: cytochrome C oxidase Cbb3, partial [Eggerthellaceae bacterium]|nr:cytochrome C oxidase Cbb3 [Eggerthellaceae bacterium]